MKVFRPLLFSCLVAAPLFAQTVTVSGELQFSPIVLNGLDQVTRAVAAPTMMLQTDRPGLHRVSIEAGPLDCGGYVLPPENLRFDPAGRPPPAIEPLTGEELPMADAEARFEGATGPLNRAVVVLSMIGRRSAKWVYRPVPTEFSLMIPADAIAGECRGKLMVTIEAGP